MKEKQRFLKAKPSNFKVWNLFEQPVGKISKMLEYGNGDWVFDASKELSF